MKLTLPVPPSSNRYWRLWRGRLHVSEEAHQYRQGVKLRALTHGLRQPLTCPVVLSVIWYREAKRGDLSNRLKVLEDALQGVAYANDSQVVEIHARRIEDPKSPRVVVWVEEAA